MKDYNDFYDDDDYARAEAEKELPVCSECGESIQDDYYFFINDEILCEECLITNYRKSVDDYIED